MCSIFAIFADNLSVMITYCTHIEMSEPFFDISYKDELMFLGSCFAEQMGMRTKEYGWEICVNPFGVLYNPLSVAAGCKRLLKPVPFSESDLFEYNGMYHSFMHHGRFSGQSAPDVLKAINDALSVAADALCKTSCLLITFGSAFVYRLKSDGQTVANCHKLPADHFERMFLTVNEIVDEWSTLFETLFASNASLKVIFTVSPIRHLKDGAHGNQLSKSILLLAQQALIDKYADRILYFPAYELMIDELRDYRFYADDLLHPSKVAVDYIWERFCDVYMKADVKEDLKEVESILRGISHRPFHPSADHHKQFLRHIFNKIRRLRTKNPYICLSKEENEIACRLRALT